MIRPRARQHSLCQLPAGPVPRLRLLGAAAAAIAALAPAPAAAQDSFPVRPIRFMVPFAAGGVSDILGRTLAQGMSQLVAHPVIVENRGGAAGTVGAAVVANATPDGYTILLSSLSTQAIAPHMQRKVPYDGQKAFAPLAGVALSPNILSIGARSALMTVKDIVAAARANPGKLSYGSSGLGSVGHLTGEMLRALSGAELTHIPFKSSAVAYPDVLAGNITMVIDTLPSALQHIKNGTVRPVVMLSPKRTPLLPDVPTIGEAGYSEATLNFWSGMFAPAGTPPATVKRLNEIIVRAIESPEVQQRFSSLGAVPWPVPPAELAARAREDYALMGKLIKGAGLTPEQ